MEFSTARNKWFSVLKSRLTSRVHHGIVLKYYSYDPRLTQIVHARLRMRSSSLNEHLFAKNSIDNSNCLCGEIESTYHYLFKCPTYTRQWNILFRKLFQLLNIRPSEHYMLFGYQTGYIMWHSRLMIYIPWAGNVTLYISDSWITDILRI
jgi:hypothetical protein